MMNPFRFFKTFFSLLAAAGWVLLILLFVVLGLALAMYYFELGSTGDNAIHGFWESLYLSVITALTVGYGDVVPKSAIGRLVSIGLGFLGIVFMGIVVAAAIKSLEKASEH